MPKRIPPDRDPQLREALALPDSDQLAQLRAMNGDRAVAADQQLVPSPPTSKPVKRRKKLDYVHPEERPNVDEMLSALASEEAQVFGRKFGSLFRSQTAHHVALTAETEIYNAWVILQCLQRDLREPGELSPGAFYDRYWEGANDEAA